MKYLTYTQITEAKGRVALVYETPDIVTEHNIPFVEVEAIPSYTPAFGKDAILYVNPQTSELWYEYEDRPLTQDEVIQQQSQEIEMLKTDNEMLKLMVADLGLQVGGGL